MKIDYPKPKPWNTEPVELEVTSQNLSFRETYRTLRNQDDFSAQELTCLISLATQKLNALYQRNALARYDEFVGRPQAAPYLKWVHKMSPACDPGLKIQQQAG